ncbi:hypothetical protein [Aureimonas jatrophae]|uniref:Uncharacterized protein n=1 Tax=Aureimonas jatrophae TaxID=1166073 RepID=A0A1H0K217_9HYPH|nr:hypothetical protein [Aureimonas jatrophae]MBB3950914.1 hypothetical protein [Aureimonas jatrophae]SDO50078.1 hypothetical protein SAMN05192530_10760 [Aureimonas jatrophae]
MDEGRATLVWGARDAKPEPAAWRVDTSDTRSAALWANLNQAINYAIGMMPDREPQGLHPWIRTPSGHIYSPAAIQVMSDAMERRR